MCDGKDDGCQREVVRQVMGIVEIKKTNVGEQVYQQMKNQILAGEWRPGEKIPSEHMLMNMFSVSRGTVRQAVQKLAGENLIETRRGEGSFVRVNRLADYFRPAFLFSVDNHEMEEIYAFRSMFESATAEAAARKATPAQIRRLERNYTRMCQETDHYEQYVHTDLEFHMMICECTQNTLALQIYNSYENLLAPSILHTTQTIGVGNGVKYHGLILEALKNRDPQQAPAVMREHMENNLEQFKRLAAGLDQHG